MATPQDKTILVVDDEDDIREYFASVLEDAGFKVMTAANGNEALERVKEKVPDFISLDLVMPDKSGIKFLYELRHKKEWAKIPFVIVTAHASDYLGKADLENILANKTFSGPGVYLEKPVSPEQYLSFIAKEVGVEYKLKASQGDVDQLQNEVQKLMKDAGPDELEEILQLLRKRKK